MIVSLWLKRIPEVKPEDRTGGAWSFWQKAYPTKFDVKRATTATGRQVVVFTPLNEELDDLDPDLAPL